MEKGTLIATVNAHELNNIHWMLMRSMFPRFAEEVELGRYVRNLMATRGFNAVHIEHHRMPDGTLSDFLFDIYCMDSAPEEPEPLVTVR